MGTGMMQIKDWIEKHWHICLLILIVGFVLSFVFGRLLSFLSSALGLGTFVSWSYVNKHLKKIQKEKEALDKKADVLQKEIKEAEDKAEHIAKTGDVDELRKQVLDDIQ